MSEFGDYFRMQRWNQGPGADQPHLRKDLVKAKGSASIAHLFRRPRVWLEGFYGSGWGTTTAQVVHRCDVTVLYPVETAHAGASSKDAGNVAFEVGRQLYAAGIDFDFIDWQSVARASCGENELHVTDARYRVLVLPDMKVLRQSTIEKALAFHRAGGIVVAVGALPEASDHAGAADPWLDAIVQEMFATTANAAQPVTQPVINHSQKDGVAARVRDAGQAVAFIATAFPRDVDVGATPDGKHIYFQHRAIADRDVYLLYGAPEDARCTLRATGSVALWDPWTGESRPLPVLAQTATHTTLALPLSETEANVIVFTPGQPLLASVEDEPNSTEIALDGDWQFEVVPSLDNRFGDFEWPPTPTMIGPEVRQIRYRPEDTRREDWSSAELDDSGWPKITQSFGPRFWRLGPLPEDVDTSELEATLALVSALSTTEPVVIGAKEYRWESYDFSWRWGLEGDPGPQGYHGLKSRVTDDFIALGKRGEHKHSSIYTREATGHRYYLWTAVHAPDEMDAVVVAGGVRPGAIWLHGAPVKGASTRLDAGANPLLLRYDDAGRSHVVVGAPAIADASELPVGSLRMRWHDHPAVLQYDVTPESKAPAGWYRFEAPPGLRGMALTVIGTPQLWIDGVAVSLPTAKRTASGAAEYRIALAAPCDRPARVAIRVAFARGCYGGAALPEPIRLDCGEGVWTPGDWSENDGLLSYSGGARYKRTFSLSADQLRGRVEIDLGEVVSSAELHVNGKSAGIRVAPPWRLDVTSLVVAGENRIEVLVYSTLANHYTTIPSRYRGKPTAGLLGPVRVKCTNTV